MTVAKKILMIEPAHEKFKYLHYREYLHTLVHFELRLARRLQKGRTGSSLPGARAR